MRDSMVYHYYWMRTNSKPEHCWRALLTNCIVNVEVPLIYTGYWSNQQHSTAVQSQKAVSAHFTGEQILPFAFAEQNRRSWVLAWIFFRSIILHSTTILLSHLPCLHIAVLVTLNCICNWVFRNCKVIVIMVIEQLTASGLIVIENYYASIFSNYSSIQIKVIASCEDESSFYHWLSLTMYHDVHLDFIFVYKKIW